MLVAGVVAQSGLDPKVSKFEDSVVIRANVTASGEQDLIIAFSTTEFMAQSRGEGRLDGGIDRGDLER